jgi:3-oxoacyl-[acyl-carrier-protein] synthase II
MAAGQPGTAAILGAGVVAPSGSGVDAFWDGMCAGRSFASRLDLTVDGLPLIGHPITDDGWRSRFKGTERRRLDPFALWGLTAMEDALEGAAGEAWQSSPPERRAITCGVGFGGIGTLTSQKDVLDGAGWRKLSPFGVASVMPSSLTAYASLRFDARGEGVAISSACASGTQAIAQGCRLISSGEADVVLAGGAEAPLDPLPMSSFARMEAMASGVGDPQRASRPYDVDRCGFVMGEGAAFLLLASAEAANSCDADVMGWVAGAAMTTDAFHIVAPDPEARGAVRCLRAALAQAGVQPTDITHVNGHGTGTARNDAAEALALAEVFGAGAVPVTSAKGAIGHLMGAAGAVEALETLLAADRGLVPPTVNADTVDLDIDVVSGSPRPIERGPALTCSFAFGGQNAALVLVPPTRGER